MKTLGFCILLSVSILSASLVYCTMLFLDAEKKESTSSQLTLNREADTLVSSQFSPAKSQSDTSNNHSFPAISPELRAINFTLTREIILKNLQDPKNREALSKVRGFSIKPDEPQWIQALEKENTIIVGYETTVENGKKATLELGISKDKFGQWKIDVEPPIYITAE